MSLYGIRIAVQRPWRDMTEYRYRKPVSRRPINAPRYMDVVRGCSPMVRTAPDSPESLRELYAQDKIDQLELEQRLDKVFGITK